MSDLIERYLSAVARELPERQRKDITAELRDEILSRIEREEEAKGRPLDRDGLEAVLVGVGHPLAVAGRYRKMQHLIGPEVFPFWWFGIKWALAIVLGLYLALFIAEVALVAPHLSEDERLPDLLHAVVATFGAVTLLAAAAEWTGWWKELYRWKPRDLPPPGRNQPSPFDRAAEIGMTALFLFVWIGLIDVSRWTQVGALRLSLGEGLLAFYWPVVAYGLLELVTNTVGLARPGDTRLNISLSLIRYAALAALMGGMLQTGRWIVVASSTLPPADLARTQAQFDLGMKIGLLSTLVFAIAMFGLYAWRLRRSLRGEL